MSVVWLGTVVGAIAIVRMVAQLVAGIGADGGLLAILGMLLVVAIAYASIAVLIERRRPGNRIAWVLAAAGLLIVLAFAGFSVGALRYAELGAADPVGGWFALVGATALGPALFVAVPLLAILFPDGRVPAPRWRIPVVVVAAMIAASTLIALIQPGPVEAELADNPLGVTTPDVAGLREVGLALLPLGLLAGALLAVVAVGARFRRGGTAERAQLKWLLAAIAVCAILLPLSFVDENGASGFSLLDAMAMASLALVPLSVGVAVMRYRLYDIDQLISRTIGWAAVTAMLAIVFTAVVVLLQTVLAPVTRENTLAVAGSTLVALALFGPLRRRVQRAVDRRFDRARYDAEATTARFVDRVRDQIDLLTLRAELVSAVNEAVRPIDAGLWLRSRSDE